MSVKQTVSQAQFSSQYGRRQSHAESQVARLLAEKKVALANKDMATTHPLLKDINAD